MAATEAQKIPQRRGSKKYDTYAYSVCGFRWHASGSSTKNVIPAIHGNNKQRFLIPRN